jgi:hypothetical protein
MRISEKRLLALVPRRLRSIGGTMSPRALVVLAVLAVGCGGAPESREAGEGQAATADAGPTVPAWCPPLEPVQVSCAIDPLVACEERNGKQPGAAYACGAWGGTTCVGFDTGCVGVLVYCCD